MTREQRCITIIFLTFGIGSLAYVVFLLYFSSFGFPPSDEPPLWNVIIPIVAVFGGLGILLLWLGFRMLRLGRL